VGSASVSEKEIQSAIGEKLNQIQNAETWKTFLKENSDKFPPIEGGGTVKVDKLALQIKGETFTLGLGFRQVFLKTTMERAKSLMNSPALFRYLYGLDAESKVDQESDTFRARIFKKVPILSDQDYVLEYKSFQDKDIWFQRASQVEDKKDFALRDNLKTLEPVKDGVVFREISYVYILRWYLRALGPKVRSVMVTELEKVNHSVKCTAESEKPVSNELATDCWQKAERAVK
jgi:hypothetical protein